MSDGAASLSHLLARAELVEDRVRALVQRRRADDPAPDDPFRGLYVNEQTVDQLLEATADPAGGADPEALAAVEAEADRAEARGQVIRLRRLARDTALTALDIELLLIALLPDLDTRFERLFGYLNDDVTRRRASVALALELAGASPMSAAARARLEASRPLLRHGLLVIEDRDRPLLTRALRVPDRVAAHLLGDDAPDPVLGSLVETVLPYTTPLAGQLTRALGSGVSLVHIRERSPGTGAAVGRRRAVRIRPGCHGRRSAPTGGRS